MALVRGAVRKFALQPEQLTVALNSALINSGFGNCIQGVCNLSSFQHNFKPSKIIFYIQYRQLFCCYFFFQKKTQNSTINYHGSLKVGSGCIQLIVRVSFLTYTSDKVA